MVMQTTKCVICGDVVLSSFLSKHEFFVHGEGSKSSDAKVKQQWKNNLYPIAGPKSVLPHSILDSVDKYLDERDSHPPEQEIPSDQCHAVAHYELANKSHQETDLKIPFNFATERQKEDPKDERPPLEQRKKIVQKPSKTARKKKKELAKKDAKKRKHQEMLREHRLKKQAKKLGKINAKKATGASFAAQTPLGPRPIIGIKAGSISMWSNSPGRWVTLVRG